MRIYLAGKIAMNDWRHRVVPQLRGAVDEAETWNMTRPTTFPILTRAIFGEHDYVGPFFLSCDHGCAHGASTHGVGAYALADGLVTERWVESDGTVETVEVPTNRATFCLGDERVPQRAHVVDLCLQGVRRADLVFAWLDDPSGFGTIYELGYARGYGRRVVLAAPDAPWMADCWFASYGADQFLAGQHDPVAALRLALSLQTGTPANGRVR